jgi:hypothetical protein
MLRDMGDGFNSKQLKAEILARSVASAWDAARLEWALEDVYFVDDPETCLCGHFPIVEVCVLRNRKNRKSAEVGNVCVNKFMGLRSDKVFDAIKRIRKDIDRAPNAETIELFFGQGLISYWERKFSLDTWRKKNLTGGQLTKRHEINQKMLASLTRARL